MIATRRTLAVALLVLGGAAVVPAPARAADPPVCALYCDSRDPSRAQQETVSTLLLNGRRLALHVSDAAGMAWGTITGGRAGDEVWLDRSFDGGASWPGGSSLGRTTSSRTARFNATDAGSLLYGGAVRACGRAVEGQNGACTPWTRPS